MKKKIIFKKPIKKPIKTINKKPTKNTHVKNITKITIKKTAIKRNTVKNNTSKVVIRKTNIKKQSNKKKIIKKRVNNTVKSILFISHNFHFIDEIINTIQNNKKYQIKKYLIKTLDNKTKEVLSKLVKKYNIIFCEWFINCAVFLSKIVDPKKQKLFIRLHRHEILKNYFLKANWKNIKKVIFVNPYIENIVKSKIKASNNKTCVIHNYIKYPAINEEMLNNDEIKFNICMVGYVPQLKRPDIAINIYRTLKKFDPRYNLYFIGKDLNFIKKNPDEVKYYNECFVNQPDFTVLPYTHNLSNFFNRMGHILVCSDVESFHVSSHEALSYGIYPYYIGQCTEYLSNIVPKEFQFKDINTLVNKVIENNNNFSKELNKKNYKEYLERYKVLNITNNILTLINK